MTTTTTAPATTAPLTWTLHLLAPSLLRPVGDEHSLAERARRDALADIAEELLHGYDADEAELLLLPLVDDEIDAQELAHLDDLLYACDAGDEALLGVAA